MSKILHLTLKKKWFDMIASGEKKEEYREIKEYWVRRLISEYWTCAYCKIITDYPTEFKEIIFRNGYSKTAPTVRVELLGIKIGYGKKEWGAEEKCFIIKLGQVIKG